MQLLVWEDRFSVGVREFDQHHKILFEMINSLIIAKAEGSEGRVILNTLEQLRRYTIFHFAAEETMMEFFGFDGLEEHAAEHQSLLDKVKAYQTRIETQQDISVNELLEFLASWLLDHTLGLDQLYGPYLNHHIE